MQAVGLSTDQIQQLLLMSQSQEVGQHHSSLPVGSHVQQQQLQQQEHQRQMQQRMHMQQEQQHLQHQRQQQQQQQQHNLQQEMLLWNQQQQEQDASPHGFMQGAAHGLLPADVAADMRELGQSAIFAEAGQQGRAGVNNGPAAR
jgi:1,4-alpha-glucan branching enzyme